MTPHVGTWEIVETGCDVCMLIQEQHIRVTNGQPLATDQTQGSGGRDNPECANASRIKRALSSVQTRARKTCVYACLEGVFTWPAQIPR